MADEQTKQANNTKQLTEQEKADKKLQDELIRLKAWYFGSKYYSVKNWITFAYVKLPENLDPNYLLDWEAEKQEYLAQDKINLQGIGEDYKKRLRDRLDTATALREKLVKLYGSIEEAKDVNQATLALKKIAEIEDDVSKLLKINSYEANIYEQNKNSTETLLQKAKKGSVKVGIK